MNNFKFNEIQEAIQDIKNGKLVIVADDEARENEGDVICAAQKITPELVNFMITECKGLICLALSREKAENLGLEPMVANNTDIKSTAFTFSIDASQQYGVTTGISAYDRAKTIQIAMNKNAKPADFTKPGHIFPLIAKTGGVLKRAGHTETAVDLARLSGLFPAGVICEIINSDGSMARRDDLEKFAKKHNLKFITVSQLISYRLKNEKFVTREASATLPTEFGTFKIIGYKNQLSNQELCALVVDDNSNKIPLVRMHSECLTGDTFHSLRCDCHNQLETSMKMISDYGKGALVYIKGHEGRGIGLINKIKAYSLQEQGQDTVEANVSLGFKSDLRNYGVGAQILADLGYTKFNLITNNPKKIIGLEGYGLEIIDRITLDIPINEYNKKYMLTKIEKMNHLLKI